MNKEEKNKLAQFVGASILKYHKKIKISFFPSETMKQGKIESTGWANESELRIATGGDIDTWLGVLVHETCHVDQSAEHNEWFVDCEKRLSILEDWLGGKKCSNKTITDAIQKLVELEWDCERRSVAKIRKNKLPINIEEYSQMANSYIFGYHWVLKNRKWCKQSYRNPKIWKAMPTRLVPLCLALTPPKCIVEIFDEN